MRPCHQPLQPTMKPVTRFSLTLLILCTAIPLQAQNLEQQFDALLEAQFPSNEPGAVALVARDGKVIYQKALGMANLELSVPMTTDMVFRIGSITKQVTAVAILMLMEQGKLNLDDPITRFLPYYPTHGHNITIHHLLTHTSGITNSTTLKPWDAHVRKKDFTPEELISYYKNEPMYSVPGELYRYNNFGYHILGYIIELASGQSYEQFVHTQIFEPLGMNQSRYGSHESLIKNRASGYTRGANGFENPEYISLTQPYAAGSLMSTTGDQLIWLNALLSNKLIKTETLKLAWSNYENNEGTKINYGYGWFLNEVNGSPTFEHAGGIQGFQTNGIYLPEEKVFVAVFSNCDRTDPRPVSLRMAALAIGKPYPAANDVLALTEKELKKWTGTYRYPDRSLRVVEYIDGWLYWSRPGRMKFRLLPSAPNRFLLENTFTQVEFFSEQDDVRVEIKARIARRTAHKVKDGE